MHFYFRQRKSFILNVGGVGHQEEDLRFIKDGIFLFFFLGDYSIHLVKLVVSRGYYPAVLSFYNYPKRVGDSVSDAEKSNFYFPASYYRVRLHDIFFHSWQVREFCLAFSHQEDGKLSGIDGWIADA